MLAILYFQQAQACCGIGAALLIFWLLKAVFFPQLSLPALRRQAGPMAARFAIALSIPAACQASARRCRPPAGRAPPRRRSRLQSAPAGATKFPAAPPAASGIITANGCCR